MNGLQLTVSHGPFLHPGGVESGLTLVGGQPCVPFHSWRKRELGALALYNALTGGCSQVSEGQVCSQGTGTAPWKQPQGSGWTSGISPPWKTLCQALEVLESSSLEMSREQLDVGISHRLGVMIPEVFSSLNDSVILYSSQCFLRDQLWHVLILCAGCLLGFTFVQLFLAGSRERGRKGVRYLLS